MKHFLFHRYFCKAQNLSVNSRRTFIDKVIEDQHASSRIQNNVNIFFAFNPNITFIPKGIGEKFPKIEFFGITKSGLRYIERSDFKHLKYLHTLNLAENKIERVSKCTFNNVENLERIILDGNRIVILHEQTFMNLLNLKYLSVNENDIVYIEADLFIHNPYLEDVFFNSNKLQVIETKFTNRMNLNFSSNPCINLNYKSYDYIVFNDFTKIINAHCTNGTKRC